MSSVQEVSYLRLVPISGVECSREYTVRIDDRWIIDDNERNHSPTTLKLCQSTEDVVDVDAYEEQDGRVIFADIVDGSPVCEFILGRQTGSGIQNTVVSRECCHVFLRKRKSDGMTVAYVIVNPMKKTCYLNGCHISVEEAVFLSDGDILSLYGPYGFPYRVKM